MDLDCISLRPGICGALKIFKKKIYGDMDKGNFGVKRELKIYQKMRYFWNDISNN